MDYAYLRQQLGIFDSLQTIESGFTPPSSWYNDQQFFKLEEKSVFMNHWLYVGRIDQLPERGSYFCGHFISQPYVVVRDEQNNINAFYNVCRHHAACVAKGEGKAQKFVCPYHSWTYDLQGKLSHAPRLDGIKNFSKKDYGLVPIPTVVFGPFIFVFFGENPWDFLTEHSALESQLKETAYENLHFAKRIEYTINCNWKVFVDNYLDGGYHVPYLHKGLASQLDLKNYSVEMYDRYSLQLCSARNDSKPQRGDFSERVSGGAIYAWLYPNFMINRYGPIMDINWTIPIGHNKTKVIFDYFFAKDIGEEFIKKSIIASDVVQQEDMDICNAVQAGIESNAYDQGRYAPLFEKTALHFHQLLYKDFANILLQENTL
ncbi:aromatic ring-hydroxylating dioxygenase subunit alpha [Candidatus Uabimicrobium sp. HlEnr_7]|uniref:aromatic ring-hydroxylating oxygenase subunit alpha n=1 Tax=Candidatus Uabimicrobium helgolandensis TaxID=3095367 RepID=UPI003555E920